MSVTKSWRFLRSLTVLFLLALVLSACTGSAERVWLKAPGWGRAQLVGNTQVGDPVPLALDDAGRIYLFLVHETDGVAYPRVVALDRDAETVWDRTFDIEMIQPDKPRILWDGEALHFFWISDQGLIYTQADTNGDLLRQPVLLSGETQVDSYDVARDADGLMTVWYAGPRRQPGLFALPPGDLTGEAVLVDAEGVRPDLQYDDSGTLHAIWAHYPPGYGDNRIFYGAYPGGVYQQGQESSVLRLRLGMATALMGPHLGLDQHQIYAFWTEVTRTGMEAGKVGAFYVHFPHGQASLASAARQWFVPPEYKLTYVSFPEGSLQAGDRVPLQPGAWGASDVSDLAINPNQEQELGVAFRARVDYLRRKAQTQIGTAFFQDGDSAAYQLLSFTSANSTDPTIVSDDAGWLYVTWLERGSLPGFVVYFASTAPDIRASLNTLTGSDVARLGAETLFGLMSGALLIPFVLIWVVVPILIVGLTSFIRGEEERLTSLGTLISLALALIAFWMGKLVVLPDMWDYVPFSAWLPVIPSWLSLPMQLGVPLLIAGLALIVAWKYTYGRQRPSPLFFVIIYAAVDGILTVAVYGGIVYGAF